MSSQVKEIFQAEKFIIDYNTIVLTHKISINASAVPSAVVTLKMG